MSDILKIHRCPKCGQPSGQVGDRPEELSNLCEFCFGVESEKRELEAILWEEAQRIISEGRLKIHGN